MTIHIPHDVVVVIITLAVLVIVPTLVSLFMLGRMSDTYTDQIKWAWQHRKWKREVKK